MSLGPIMMDLVGYSLSELESQQIQEGSVGGIILFKRNYKNKAQLVELVREIRSIKPNILISVDHEGGRVWRFEDDFTKLPAMGDYWTNI
jgi:beta-N-acetylhexosaminidase